MSEEIEKRLIQIESTLAHMEDMVEKLNQVVTDQTMTVDRLRKDNEKLVDMLADSEMEEIRNNNQPPPHYGKG